MASNWQETYEQLKKRKKLVDTLAGGGDLAPVKTTKSSVNNRNLYTNGAETILQKNVAPTKTTTKKTTAKKSTTTKKKDDKKWYQDIFDKGAFDDGYDFGDVTKTILGTTVDLGAGFTKSVSDIGVSAAKLVAGGIAQIGDSIGQDEWADKVRNRIAGKDEETNEKMKKYTISGWLGTADEKLDDVSALGETGDEIVQGAGYLGGMMALQSVGVPWQVTAGVTSMGEGLGEAYANDATDAEAWLSAGISAGVEIGTEYLFGGVKLPGTGKTADKLLGQVTDKISKKGVKYLTQAGLQMAGEGIEEVLSGIGSAIGQKLTYMDEYKLKELYSSEDALKEFVIGAAVSGISIGGSPNTYQAIREGRSLITEETDTQQQDETELRRTNFTYDATKVNDEFEIATYESASRVMNDTKRTHEFVDPIAKMAKEKGTYYEFTNNEELAKTNYRVEGRTVNGLTVVEENGKRKVLINIDSPKALNTIVGHETTHLLEGTQEYEELKQAIFELAKQKGELDTRRNDLVELYKDIKNADIDAELTADLVGDYLFTDSEFINNLAVEKPTLFQKIKDLIDDLVIRFTGTKEERQLRQVQKAFRNAYSADTTQINTDTKYMITGLKGVENAVNTNIKNDFLNQKYNDALKMDKSKTYSNEQIWKETGWFKDKEGKWKYEISDADAKITKELTKNNNYTLEEILSHKDLYIMYPELKGIKVSTQEIETFKGEKVGGYYDPKTNEIVLNNILLDTNNNNKITKLLLHEIQHIIQETEGFNKGYDGKSLRKYLRNLGEIEAEDVARRYDLTPEEFKNIAPESTKSKPIHPTLKDIHEDPDSNSSQRKLKNKAIAKEYKKAYNVAGEGNVGKTKRNLENDSISTNSKIRDIYVGDRRGRRYSISEELDNSSFFNTDNQGRELSKEQQEYFKDSKVRDENGNLLTMYHGSPNEFTIFDKSLGDEDNVLGEGLYFTSDWGAAEHYSTKQGTLDNGKVYETYLNIKNPFIIDDLDTGSLAKKIHEISPDVDIMDHDYGVASTEKMTNYLIDNGYDGIKAGDETYVAFEPNQIKNIDNTNPTSDADIRYSLSEKGTLQDNNGNDVTLETSETGTHGTLMAIHNLSDSKLKGILELGGFPLPSIAIMNPATTGLSYGDISVLFDKQTIDPSNTSNEVYGSDVYSPRFPQTIQKVNEKELSKLESYIGKSLYLEDTTLDDTVQKNRYTKEFINKFAEENNITVEDIYKDSGFNYTFSTDENVKNFVIENDVTYDKLFNDVGLREEFYKLYRESNPTLIGLTERKIETFEKIFNEYGNTNNSTADRLNSDFNAIKNGQEKVLDEYATEKALRDKVLDQYEEQYTNFLNEKFSPVFGDKYIRNNKDVFTPSGNRRSFKQLYNEYTLDNVVKAMKGKVRGEEGFFYGAGNIRSQVTPQFKSIAEIKENESSLVTNSVMEAAKQEIELDLNNLSDMAKAYGGYSYDSYEAALNEIASLKKITPTKAKNILNDYGFENVPDILIDESIEFLEKLKNAPTEYFEAKPQRAVGLDEVQAIVIPNYSSTEFKQQLQDAGLKYYEYDPNIEGDKQRVINQFDDLKFSLSQQGQDIAPTGNYNVYSEEVKLQVEEAIAPLKEEINNLTENIKNLMDNEVPEVEQIAPTVEQVSTQPTKAELDNLMALQETGGTEYANEFFRLRDKYGQPKLYKGINEYKKSPNNYGMIEEGSPLTEADLNEFYNQSSEVFKTITDEDAPMPMEDATPDYDYEKPKVESALEDRNIEEVGNRKVKAYQYENPEVRPYFKEAAQGMLYDLNNTTKGERIYNDEVYYNTNGNEGWVGLKRQTTDDIADLLDNFNYSYADIRKGLEAIIKDHGAENIAVAKRIEFALDDRLRNGYTAVDGLEIPANQEYIDLLRGKEFASYYNSIPGEDIAPIEMNLEETSVIAPETKNVAEKVLKTTHENIAPKVETNKVEPTTKKLAKESSNKVEKTKSTNPIRPREKGSTIDTLNYLLVNRNVAIDKFAKETGNNNIKFLADHVNNVSGEISTNINKAQINNDGNVIGKSIVDIFNQARKAKLSAAFDDYLFHLSNKARHKQGKGTLVPLTESTALIIEYEKAYPEMKKWAREVNKYNRNNLYKQVEAGLYSKEFADGLVKKYDFYVPFFADVQKAYMPTRTKSIKPRGTVGLARGGASRNLLNFEEAMMRQTQSAITSIRKNQLYQEIVNSSPQVSIGSKADANGLYVDEDGYYLTAKENGDNVSAYISEELYRGLENRLGQQIRDVEQRLSGLAKPLQAIGNFRRKILTTWSPTFVITNPLKDIQDAPLNSKYAKDWTINYPKAFNELATGKGEHLQTFLNMYGEAGIMGDYVIDSGVTDVTKAAKTKKKLGGITRLNEMLELAPRYAEYLASIKNGTSQMEALYNAREVTTNFGRGGVLTKALNRNGFTFLNASVQGFNKLYRNFSGENGAKGVVNASLKAVMLGVVPALYNALSYDDDEDYEALPDYIKDNYYLYKTDDGEFIRIPKGRMISIFGSAARRALEYSKGEEDAFEGYFKNAYSQVGIQNPMESNIFAPILQAYGSKNGQTWYGTDLVPTRLQDVPAAEQYDESTDKFSIWLGETFGISPYKVNYIFDQYSGGIGDLLLPTITEEANSDGSFLAPIKDKFVVNSTMDNKYAGEFYTKRDELEVKANSMYATEEDKLMSEYMDQVSWDMSALYKEKREIQNDTSLTKKEKFERVKEIQKLINETAKNALETYNTGTYMENYTSIGDYEFYMDYDEENEPEWRTVYDYKAEDLAALGMTDEEKNEYFGLKQKFNAINDEYYNTKDGLESKYGKHSDEFEDESDELYMNKKNKIIDGIMSSNLTDEAKAYLYKEYYSSSAMDTITMSNIPVDYILDYQKNTFKADYDSDGTAIRNSRKNKVIDYVNEYDLDVAEKAIIIKSTNTFKFNDYNDEIVNYVADLDISDEDKIYILEELGMTVDDEGYAHWSD